MLAGNVSVKGAEVYSYVSEGSRGCEHLLTRSGRAKSKETRVEEHHRRGSPATGCGGVVECEKKEKKARERESGRLDGWIAGVASRNLGRLEFKPLQSAIRL